ncbi:hypothetical protein C8J56DRAFT_928523 [Mycena floridula]|nr:hypothetical protein C8J56DRAFT_855849 [Mycena floridula]KAJ7595134.1 hypothetical protein C8J56DRAFT_928523 [Mycena floridula]
MFKFSALVLLASVASAAVVDFQTRDTPDQSQCIKGKFLGTYGSNNGGPFSAACLLLESDCITKMQSGTPNIWSEPTCVAGATCGTPWIVHLVSANCTAGSKVAYKRADTPSLSYNIYADIVGDCAWAPNGCSMSEQNYIDWFYGTLSSVNSKSWPDSVDQVKNEWWTPIKTWTNTGETIPYLNFNDWLHFGPPFD